VIRTPFDQRVSTCQPSGASLINCKTGQVRKDCEQSTCDELSRAWISWVQKGGWFSCLKKRFLLCLHLLPVLSVISIHSSSLSACLPTCPIPLLRLALQCFPIHPRCCCLALGRCSSTVSTPSVPPWSMSPPMGFSVTRARRSRTRSQYVLIFCVFSKLVHPFLLLSRNGVIPTLVTLTPWSVHVSTTPRSRTLFSGLRPSSTLLRSVHVNSTHLIGRRMVPR